MLERREHKRVLTGLRQSKGRQLEGHRAELDQARAAWRRAKETRPGMHRVVLEGERAELQRSRRFHRAMLVQNRWLVVLAERVQQRLKKAG